jgi:hypothetical protein
VDTEIRYLELVGDDLRDAARRETERTRERVTARGRRRRLAWPVLAGAAAIVVLAGLVGVLATGRFAGDEAGQGGVAATGATGATGEIERRAGLFASPVPPGALSVPYQGGDLAELPPDLALVIRTARLEIVIPRDSFDDRFAEAADVAGDHGGFVQDSTTRQRSGEITMRIPAAGFDAALADLRELGEVGVQRIEGQDVTGEYLDLQARLRIAQARREVLLRLMEEAGGISQTIRVQNALDETQLRIEELQGQISVLDDRTTFATIRLSLREQGVEPEAEVEQASLPNAVERAAAGFVGVIAAIVIGLGYLLPLALLGGIIWGIVVLIRRRRA